MEKIKDIKYGSFTASVLEEGSVKLSGNDGWCLILPVSNKITTHLIQFIAEEDEKALNVLTTMYYGITTIVPDVQFVDTIYEEIDSYIGRLADFRKDLEEDDDDYDEDLEQARDEYDMIQNLEESEDADPDKIRRGIRYLKNLFSRN